MFVDVIVDPDNIEANRVFPSDPLVLGNFTGQIFVRFSGRDGVLEVNADSTVNGVTAISGSVLIHGRDGDSGTVRIIGNGTSGSARIDITEGVGLRNSLGGNGLLDIRNGGVLESHEQDISWVTRGWVRLLGAPSRMLMVKVQYFDPYKTRIRVGFLEMEVLLTLALMAPLRVPSISPMVNWSKLWVAVLVMSMISVRYSLVVEVPDQLQISMWQGKDRH